MKFSEAIDLCRSNGEKATRPSWSGAYFVVVFDETLRPPRFITDVRNADGSDAPNVFTADDKSAEDWAIV